MVFQSLIMCPSKPLQPYLWSHPLSWGPEFSCTHSSLYPWWFLFPLVIFLPWHFQLFPSLRPLFSSCTCIFFSILECCDICPLPQERYYTTCLYRDSAYWDRDFYNPSPFALISLRSVFLLMIIYHWVLHMYCNTRMTES